MKRLQLRFGFPALASVPVPIRLSTILILAAGCARSVGQTTPARQPPARSSESRVVNTTPDSTREYRGEWESGFETSVFRDCNGTAPGKVWISLAPGANVGARWSSNTSAAGTRRYYVRVRGILRGPVDHRRIGAGYGHLGGFDYELYVTRVLEVKPPGQPDCVVQR